ncbi:acyl-CoA dehydrogenase family protein [Streptomyces sp. GMR22]|uniref:acyl-CoA dehydrogenase family protein n=1 Tax=Streptomyces sp. GMR22 TaxID=2759524 RepID=UPI0015F80298|nr:acyl-CoA dehydrogenase family protein [Streptomyces sp. GMR22]MBA6440771.1 acyl-CoA/acyl-ACP dehydrogenase [Streptomyces sp. GMR22]
MVNAAGLTTADQDLLERVTAFVDGEVIPAAADRDHLGEYPADLVRRMKELGLFATSTRSLPLYALVSEEIGRGWISLSPVLNAHTAMVWALMHHGTQAQRERWLDDLTSGRRLAALALTEPHGGSDLQAVRSAATPADRGWEVTAHKTFITHSRHADLLMMLVRTDPRQHGTHRGLSLIVLEAGEWRIQRDLPKLGSRSIETCELNVDHRLVDTERVIGDAPGSGFRQVMDCLEVGRIAVAAAAVGVGRAALWSAVRRSKERHAFGRPVSAFQNVTTTLGHTAIQLQAARALTLRAASDKAVGGRHDAITSAAKVFSADTAVAAALAAMELHGGAGYLTDHAPERFLRDATLYLAGEGSNGLLTDLVGRRLLTTDTSLDWI